MGRWAGFGYTLWAIAPNQFQWRRITLIFVKSLPNSLKEKLG
jgi:hypothetical protein